MVAEEEEENRVEVSKFYFTIDGCSNFIDTNQIGTWIAATLNPAAWALYMAFSYNIRW